jgi:hypothetical protein
MLKRVLFFVFFFGGVLFGSQLDTFVRAPAAILIDAETGGFVNKKLYVFWGINLSTCFLGS